MRYSAGLVGLAILAALQAQARGLGFEERVRAQEAIERVYHAHQIGSRRPFEKAMPRTAIEDKVRRYLRQSALLEQRWNRPLTADMLELELKRMARATRMPDRLRELFAALHNDPFLVQECLARGILADRL